jgi:hypothetical protein
MASYLIVEDGTGLPTANTYIDVEFAKEYAATRGVDLGTDEVISANLVLAAEYIDAAGPYLGVVHNYNQGLEFPRDGLKYRKQPVPDGVIHINVKRAQAQLLLDIKESGALLTSNRQFALKRRKLDILEQEYAVGSYAAYAPTPKHPTYDNLMKDFVSNAGRGGYLIR